MEMATAQGVMKDIWTKMADRNSQPTEIESVDDELFPTDVNNYCCCLDAEAPMEPPGAEQGRAEIRIPSVGGPERDPGEESLCVRRAVQGG